MRANVGQTMTVGQGQPHCRTKSQSVGARTADWVGNDVRMETSAISSPLFQRNN